jgi:hypothetical protein
MKITLKNLKPRNPLVALSLHRQAGSHRSSQGACRQQAARALRREIESVASSRHSP